MHKCAQLIVTIILAGVVAGIFYPSAGRAQPPGADSGFFDPNLVDDEDMGEDTTELKMRKPLESYFFDDSTRNRPNFAWNIDTYINSVKLAGIDTAISGFQHNYPYLRRGVGDAYQGNMGGASIPLSYFDRPDYRDFSFASAFDAFYFTPENVRFFNVKKPFTQFSYYTAGQTRKREEGFGITHAQNISPSTGFNLDYKSQGTRGYYNWSKGRDKNLSVAFNHTGKRYSVHAGYIYNTVQNKENGGIVDHRMVSDTVYDLPENIPTHLQDARTEIKNNTYYLMQSYGIPLGRLTDEDFSIAGKSSLFFGHSFSYHRWRKLYTDTRANSVWTNELEGPESYNFYDKWYIDPTKTRDSIFESKMSNRFFVQIQPFDRDGIVGLIDAGFGIDNHYYYQYVPGDLITGNTEGIYKTNYYIYGAIDGKFRRYFDWGADVRFFPAGPRSGDLRIGANAAVNAYIKGSPVTLAGKFTNDLRSPSYWSEQFFSNHYVWSNSFNKENESRIELSLTIPHVAFEFGASQSVVTDKIYFNADKMPAQHSGSVSVSGLYAEKDFRIGGLNLKHRVLLQWSTADDIVPVPLASAYLSYYFEFNIVRDVLRARIGLDGRYNTKYYAFGYNPATASFYNQREQKVGGYPLIDFYAAMKWKRMRILLKLEHFNEDMFGTRNYFTLLDYPLNKRVFKMGISWSFYD